MNAGYYVPTLEERKATYSDYISRIYAILVNYEATKQINKPSVGFLCFEIQSYGNLLEDNELLGLPSKLSYLLSDDVEYPYIRKVVLDATNFLTRLIHKG